MSPPEEKSNGSSAASTRCNKQECFPSSSASKLAMSAPHKLNDDEASRAVDSFRKLIRFETVSVTAPATGEYTKCANYLLQQLHDLQCLDNIHTLEESPHNSPVVVARWKGTDANADTMPIILLNSHYDVVPANAMDWSDALPFEAEIKNGKIYGRGTQDMKCVCVQYMEAIRILHTRYNYRPCRHVYLTFVPDEEVGGAGIAAFLDSKLFRDVISPPGIALAMDEGLASTTNTFSVFYGERLPWWITVTSKGNTGHGSRFIESTAVEQIIDLCHRALAFRTEQRELLHGTIGECHHSNCSHAIAAKNRQVTTEKKNSGSYMKLGDVTSLNITTLQAGVKTGNDYTYNVVPPAASCSFDIRIAPHIPPSDIKDMIDNWCQECKTPNGSLDYSFLHGNDDSIGHALTEVDPNVNPWYGCFANAMDEMGLSFIPEVFPAATDSRFLRALGIRALGFSPMRNSEILLHENNEHLKQDVFVEGVGIMVGIIGALGSQGPEVDM